MSRRWENFMTEDAELILVAYGISSRICKSAVRRAREAGMKLGLIRPITHGLIRKTPLKISRRD